MNIQEIKLKTIFKLRVQLPPVTGMNVCIYTYVCVLLFSPFHNLFIFTFVFYIFFKYDRDPFSMRTVCLVSKGGMNVVQ